MELHGNFVGGNIEIVNVEGCRIDLKNQIRDSAEDWFYWAFCVEGAQGETLTFHFHKPWIGYYGPAVSHDGRTWRWLGSADESRGSDCFTYTFGPHENRVYFAHDMLYHPDRFTNFCKASCLEQKVLCQSEAGRSVPYICIGSGEETILFTARHHACESTGSYVLEGILEEVLQGGLPGFQIIAVPFVDYDGVVQGDQGKARRPWDHNRDYDASKEALYTTVRAIREIAGRETVRYAFDFHSPWHLGGENDDVFIPQKHSSTIKSDTRFANILEQCTTPGALPYEAIHTVAPDAGWNHSATPCFGNYMYWTAGAELAFTLEIPYFRASGCAFSEERAKETGRCFVRALRRYHTRPVKISFTGDLLYNQPVNERCKTARGYDYLPLFTPVRTRLPDTDYLVGNIESPIAGRENGGYTHERYSFNTPAEALTALKDIGFDLLSLANNHCMDRGPEGIEATLEACGRAGLEHIGLYRTQEESEAVFVRRIGGVRVGFVNATYGTNAFAHHRFLDKGKEYMVKLTQPEETLEGAVDLLAAASHIETETHRLYRPVQPVAAPYLARLKQDIKRTKEQADYVVMLLHSGGQYNTLPDAYTRMLVEKIREYGADIVIANHPHVIQPSIYEEPFFAAYCLGNFISMEPDSTIDCALDPSFSTVVNLYLAWKEGKLEPHISFRLCQTLYENGDNPRLCAVDTYDAWKKHPTEAYRRQILTYANLFMPGRNYTEPQAEYAVV